MTATSQPQVAPPLARFRNLVPYQSQHAEKGIPRELMEYLTANRVFPVVSPAGLVGRNAAAHLRGWPGLCITIAQCTPQQGPVAHNHTGTLETFFCMNGRFDVMWGNRLEHKVTVEPGDLVSVPPGMYRAFRNLTDEPARLLVLIQGDRNMSDKIEMPRYIGEEVRAQYGEEVLDMLAAINMRFQGENTPDFTSQQMALRTWRARGLAPGLHPIMAPAGGAAPIACWPGLNVSLLLTAQGEQANARVPDEHREWIVNVGEQACEVVLDGEPIELAPFDMLCAEAGAQRTIRATGGARVLLALQGSETITH
ncbi:MAG TPA: cupin domain-containing protein [Noviherbaspirillum sp.]